MKVLWPCFAGFFLGSVLLAQAPASAPAEKSALDKKVLEEYIRHLRLWGPQITVAMTDPVPANVPGMVSFSVTASAGQAQVTENFLATKDGKQILKAEIFDMNKSPFQTELDGIHNDLQPSMGTAGAPVVITLFSDFQCAYCREEAKVLRDNLLKAYPTEVRLYFRDFPLDQIHPWARTASLAGRCVFRAKPAAFWEYHDWIFENQAQITVENVRQKISEWVQSKGLDSLQILRCLDTKATLAEVEKNLAEGRALRIEATPTMFVNGRRIAGNIPWQNLKMVIDWDLGYSKRTGQQAEACCRVTLPSPLNPK